MAKNAITDYSTTAASNTDVGGVDIQGSAAASNIDDMGREIMSHLADTNAGNAPWADTMTIGDAADLTKKLRFELSGITTATTRVLTVPNIDGTIVVATAAGAASLTSTDDGATAGPVFSLDRNSASPAASDVIGAINYSGRDNGGGTDTYALTAAVITDPAAGSEDGEYIINTVVAGTIATRLRLGAGLYTPNATGGDKGLDTINASAVYDDNVLLTCYVFDAALDGAISEAKWDAKVPDRKRQDGTIEVRNHNDMRKFRDRLGTNFDPLDIDAYTKHWKEKRHLTSMPNEATFDPVKGLPTGTWIQRLVETVEIQAVHIAKLHDRLKALEA